jgi:AbrB family looped-hinge helix DNA binding protein
MARTMSITSKYQVTVPKEVRDLLHLQHTDGLTFSVEKGRVFIDKVPSIKSIQSRAQRLMRERGIQPASESEITRAREIFREKRLTWQ